MTTPNTPPKLYIPKDCPHLAYDHGAGGNCHLTAHLGGHAENTLARAVATYNALAGIHDPAAALTAARDALQYAIRMLDAKEHDVAFVQKALNLLTPAP